MKKEVTICILVLFAWLTAASQTITYNDNNEMVSGWTTNLSYELTIPSGSHGRWDTGSGVSLTGTYRMPIGKTLFFEPGIGAYYSTMGNDYLLEDNSVYEGTVKNIGIRVPLMLGVHLHPSSRVALYLATGPWLNINLYARESAMPDVTAPVPVPHTINLFHRGFRRVEGLWGLQLSMTFKEHYIVGITASTAFTPLASFGNHDNKIRIRRSTVGIMLGYKF